MTASIFIPHELCEALASAGRLELDGDELTLTTGRGRYRVREALRVIKEVARGTDAPGLCGTVQLRTHVTDELGAELLGDSMLLDDSAYDVVPGVLAEPIGLWEPLLDRTPCGERAHLTAI